MTTVSILIVDDDDQVRDLLVRYLGAQGYQTVAVATGEEAVAHLDRRDLDLIITDFKMPGMNGLELARKALTADPDRPVILMSASVDVDNLCQLASSGISDFILKPFYLADMGFAVRRALSRRHLLAQSQVPAQTANELSFNP